MNTHTAFATLVALNTIACANIVPQEAKKEVWCNEIQKSTVKRIEELRNKNDGWFAQTCMDWKQLFFDADIPYVFWITNDWSTYRCVPVTSEGLNCQGPLTNKETLEKFEEVYEKQYMKDKARI